MMQQILSNKKIVLMQILAGLCLGLGAFFLPPLYFAGAIAAIAVVVAILWKVELGIYMTVALIPVVPTTAVLGLACMTIAAYLIRIVFDRTIRMRFTTIDLFVTSFAAVLFFASITSYTLKNSLVSFAITAVFIAFYFVVTNTIKTKQQLFILINLIVIMVTLTALYGLYQYKTGDISSAAWIDQEMFQDIKVRVSSTFGNPNVLGEYLVLVLPLAVALLYAKKGLFYNLITLAMSAIILVCIQLTYSRGAMLGFILAAGLFVLIRDRRLMLLGLPALFAAPFLVPASIINRLTSIGNLQDTSSAYRLSVWQGSLRIAQEYWLSGIGLGQEAFKLVYPRYSFGAAYALHAHNIYIQLALETGIFGLILFLLLLLTFFKMMLVTFKKTKDGFISAFMIAVGAGLAGYLFQGLVDNIWFNNRVVLTFWVVMALGICAYKQVKCAEAVNNNVKTSSEGLSEVLI